MKNREIWDQFSLIRDYCKAGYRKTVVSAVGLSLLDGVRPFITTVLLGLLIDGVYAGASFPELLRLALTALGLECLCYCLSSILTEIHNQKHDFIYEQQNGLLNRRLLFMNYPHLEEAQTHTLLHTIRNAGTDHGLIGLVLDDWKEFLKALTAIVSALVIAFPLFTRVRPLAEGFLNSWLASLLLFAVIAGLVYFSFRVDIRYGKRIRDAHKKRASDESLLEHYMGIFETAERQKDLRLYGQQELIGRQTDEASGRVQKEVDAEAALAARGELLRRAATALIGLLVYLFAGLRAFLGLITIGSVVTYAAGIVQMSQALADLMQVIPEIDLKMLSDYAASKNVGLILWAGYWAFDRDMENVCKYFSEMGIKGFKVDFMDRDDQVMVDFHRRAAEMTAKYGLMVDFHGTYKPTGLHRTYPNVINYEGVHGLEQMKWSGTDVDQVTYDVTIPFVRMMAGPMDYTQGAMRNAARGNYRPVNSEAMSQGTRCRQLAEYVVFESPLNMLCDSPSNYMQEQECTEFIAEIPTVWDETSVLDGRIAEYIATARRSGDTWYLGVMTDWNARDITVDLSFLGEGDYEMTVYRDGINADRAGRDYVKETISVPASRKVAIHMAPGGGYAAKIVKK